MYSNIKIFLQLNNFLMRDYSVVHLHCEKLDIQLMQY
jgi:hypothetical protein